MCLHKHLYYLHIHDLGHRCFQRLNPTPPIMHLLLWDTDSAHTASPRSGLMLTTDLRLTCSSITRRITREKKWLIAL